MPGRRSILMMLAGISMVPVATALAGNTAAALHIASEGDELRFKPDRLTCRAGKTIRLIFHHNGTILNDPHNWVLLKPGTVDAFLADADKIEDDKTVVPPQDKDLVIAATPMCARHKTVTVTFIAPAAGDYPFVCSVPGHGATMRGTLTVTA